MHPAILFDKILFKLQLRDIAPPKSYPTKKTLFFGENLNILNISAMNSIGWPFSLNFYALEVNLFPVDAPKPGKSTEKILQFEKDSKKKGSILFQSCPSHPYPYACNNRIFIP